MEKPTQVRLAFATFPSIEDARRVTAALVTERLIACANLIPGVESVYFWNSKLENSSEVLVLMKTDATAWSQSERRYHELHSYEIPALVLLEPDQVAGKYAEWILQNCSRHSSPCSNEA